MRVKALWGSCLLAVSLLVVTSVPAAAGTKITTPSISVNDITVGEAVGTGTFTLTLTETTDVAVTVQLTYASGTAAMGQDFNPITTQVEIPGGETAGYADFAVLNDAMYEPSELFTVALQNPVNASIADGRGQATITDNDAPPVPAVSVSDGSASEGAGTVQLNMTLSNPSNVSVRVDVATSNGTATSGSDFVPALGYVFFPPGVTAKTIILQINEDTLDEPDEDFFFNLTNPQGMTIGDGQARITIIDNDLPKPSISVADVTIAEGVGDALITLSLSHAYSQAVGVDVSTVAQTAQADIDYTAVGQTITFETGVTSKVVAVPIVNDAAVEDTETLLLRLSSPTNAILADADAQIQISDDDAPVSHARSVSLTLRKHLVAKGKVSADEAFDGCTDGVEVLIQRKRSSGWKSYSTLTDVEGRFNLEIPDRTGRYRAKLVEHKVAGAPEHVCKGAFSGAERHRH